MGTKVLAKAIKGVSTMDIIRGIEEGEENYKPFPVERERYLRTRCSGILKWEFKDRKYSVNVVLNEITNEKEARVSWEPVNKEKHNG